MENPNRRNPQSQTHKRTSSDKTVHVLF